MKLLLWLLLIFALVLAGLYLFTRYQVGRLEARFPAFGSVTEIGGRMVHFLDVVEGDNADLPPVLFIHGASGNLRDQAAAFQEKLTGRGRLIFVDRPGHGYSQAGPLNGSTIVDQAAVYAELLDDLGIEKAVVVCHSMGCASAAAMAVNHPERVAGLVFVAPATHRWPGGVTWYYEVAARPVIGWFFTEFLALPFGLLSMESGAKSVFEPNALPPRYLDRAAVPLVLRPQQFRNNARDVTRLKAEVTELQPRYSEITAPTVIVTGNADTIVLPEIHSTGLERDIKGSELIVLDGVGHKPDYVATDTIIRAIEKVAKAN